MLLFHEKKMRRYFSRSLCIDTNEPYIGTPCAVHLCVQLHTCNQRSLQVACFVATALPKLQVSRAMTSRYFKDLDEYAV